MRHMKRFGPSYRGAPLGQSNNSMNRATAARPPVMLSVCARHSTERAGWESPRQVIAEPKARRRARASSRGGV
jgi:hypothetical protein